jgi:hypothetical protein
MTKVVLHLPKAIVHKLASLPTERSVPRTVEDILAVLCGELKPVPSYLIMSVREPIFWPLGDEGP